MTDKVVVVFADPAQFTSKFYVPDLGDVRDVSVKGPTEELLLAQVENPR